MAFTRITFTVEVNHIRNTIAVSETSVHHKSSNNFDDSGQLAFNAIQSLNLVAVNSSPMLSPILGLTLHNNYRSYMISLPAQHDPKVDCYSKAVSDSFTSMIDDILGGYGAAQLHVTEAFEPTDVTGKCAAIRIGEATFIYVTAAINILLLLLVLVEALRTRFWNRMPLFDYLDTKSVMVAASGAEAI